MLAEMITWFASFRARWWTYRQLVSALFVSIASIREFKVAAGYTFRQGYYFLKRDNFIFLFPRPFVSQNEAHYNISSYLTSRLQIFMHLSLY